MSIKRKGHYRATNRDSSKHVYFKTAQELADSLSDNLSGCASENLTNYQVEINGVWSRRRITYVSEEDENGDDFYRITVCGVGGIVITTSQYYFGCG